MSKFMRYFGIRESDDDDPDLALCQGCGGQFWSETQLRFVGDLGLFCEDCEEEAREKWKRVRERNGDGEDGGSL